MLIIGQDSFFHKYGLAAQTSQELIFHIIKCREQASVLLSVAVTTTIYIRVAAMATGNGEGKAP